MLSVSPTGAPGTFWTAILRLCTSTAIARHNLTIIHDQHVVHSIEVAVSNESAVVFPCTYLYRKSITRMRYAFARHGCLCTRCVALHTYVRTSGACKQLHACKMSVSSSSTSTSHGKNGRKRLTTRFSTGENVFQREGELLRYTIYHSCFFILKLCVCVCVCVCVYVYVCVWQLLP